MQKKEQQHYVTYSEKIDKKRPLFEIKALINGVRTVCKTKAGEQMNGSLLVLETGDITSTSAKKVASQKFLEALKITISGTNCRISPAYRVLTRKSPWDEEYEERDINNLSQ